MIKPNNLWGYLMGQPPSISNMSLVDNGGFCAMWVYNEPVDGVAGCNDIIMRYNVVRICNLAKQYWDVFGFAPQMGILSQNYSISN